MKSMIFLYMVWLLCLHYVVAFTSVSPMSKLHKPPKSVAQTTGTNNSANKRFMMENGSDENSEEAPPPSLSRKSRRRAGGRSRLKRNSKDTAMESSPSKPGWVRKYALPLVALLLVFQFLLSEDDYSFSSSSNYYYYQSSVYQSSVYGPDGRVDTSRKESVRSNVPGLIDGRSHESAMDANKYLEYGQNPDRNFDDVLDRAIDSMMQKTFNDMIW